MKKLLFLLFPVLLTSCMQKAHYDEELLPKNIVISEIDSAIFLAPQCYEMDEALILYPGGLIDGEAYIPLAAELADILQIAVFIQKMPFNLAVFGRRRADDLLKSYSYIDTWYMAGHSLGGVMAASYVNEYSHIFQGLILLASYPQSGISLWDSNIPVLSISGSKDGVVNKPEFEKSKKRLPVDTAFIEIEGANHAQYGSYGKQKGDNQALISEREQQNQTAVLIKNFIDRINHRTVY